MAHLALLSMQIGPCRRFSNSQSDEIINLASRTPTNWWSPVIGSQVRSRLGCDSSAALIVFATIFLVSPLPRGQKKNIQFAVGLIYGHKTQLKWCRRHLAPKLPSSRKHFVDNARWQVSKRGEKARRSGWWTNQPARCLRIIHVYVPATAPCGTVGVLA